MAEIRSPHCTSREITEGDGVQFSHDGILVLLAEQGQVKASYKPARGLPLSEFICVHTDGDAQSGSLLA